MLQYPIGSMYGIYANIWGILMVNVTIYSIHGSYGICSSSRFAYCYSYGPLPVISTYSPVYKMYNPTYDL